MPLSKKAVGLKRLGTASRRTNVLNYVGHQLVGPVNLTDEAGRWAFRHLGSRSLVTLAGRANVLLAWGFLAYDAVSIGMCIAED
jgi:hypothetical protein